MMRILLLLSIPLFLTGCQERIKGNGEILNQEYILDAFNEVKVSGMFEVVLTQGEPGVLIETDENLQEHITAEVKDEKLHISSGNKYLDTDHLVVTVFYRSLEEIEVSGACELVTNGSINGDDLTVHISGAAEADLTLNVTKFKLEVTGSGEIELHGIADAVAFDLSGAAEVHAYNLNAKAANIGVSGAGEIEVNASDKLNVSISGAGEVKYKGNPEISQDITGVGELTRE